MTKMPLNMEDDQNTPETSKITEIEVSGYFGCFKDIFDKLKVLRVFHSFYRFRGNFGIFLGFKVILIIF